MKNKAFIKTLLYILILLVITLAILFVSSSLKINKLNKQIDNLKEINQELTNSKVENFVIFSFVNQEGIASSYYVDKTLEISIYDFLLTLINFTVDSFATYDGTNYYLKNGMTRILDLDESFYDDWGFLEIGLQAIIIKDNLVLYNDPFPS